MASNSCLEEKYSRFSDQRAHFARIPRLFREKWCILTNFSPPGVAMLKSPPNKLVPDCQSSGADKQDTRSSVIINPCSPTQKIRIKYLSVTCNYVSLKITMHHYPSAPITVHHYTSLHITTYHYTWLHITTFIYTRNHSQFYDLLKSDETIQMHYKNEVIKNKQCIKNTRSSIEQQLQKKFSQHWFKAQNNISDSSRQT